MPPISPSLFSYPPFINEITNQFTKSNFAIQRYITRFQYYYFSFLLCSPPIVSGYCPCSGPDWRTSSAQTLSLDRLLCSRADASYFLMASKRAAVATDAPRKKRGKSDEDKQYDREHEYSVIQCKLNSILRDGYKDILGPLLEDVAHNMSRIVFEAWMLAELHVMRMLDENKELGKLDQSFFMSCCVLVSDTKRGGGSDELKASMEIYRALRPPDWVVPKNSYMSQLMCLCAKEMDTAFKNHINVNLVTRLKKYALVMHNLSSKDAGRFIASTFIDPDPMLTNGQKEFRAWFGRNPYLEVNTDNDMAHVLNKLHDIQKFYDTLEDGSQTRTKGLRTFTLLPKKAGYVTSFVHIDRFALLDLLKLLPSEDQNRIFNELLKQVQSGTEMHNILLSRQGLKPFASREVVENVELAHALWNLLFDCKQFETSNRHVKYLICTNGCSVSVYLQKPKGPSRAHLVDGKDKGFDRMPSNPTEAFDHFVGVDPGKNYVMSAYSGSKCIYEGKETKKDRCVKVSNNQIRMESKMDEHQTWERRLRRNNTQYTEAISSLPSLKTGSLEALQTRIQQTLTASVFLFGFCRTRAFRQRRFKATVYNKKAMASAVKKILDNKDPTKTLVGHGDWSNPQGFKGKEPAPCKKLRRALRKAGATVVEINEFRTSIVCSKCCKVIQMKNVCYKNKKGKRVECHETIRCTNSECGVCWQRDVNGSRNIYSILMATVNRLPRPPALCRGSAWLEQ